MEKKINVKSKENIKEKKITPLKKIVTKSTSEKEISEKVDKVKKVAKPTIETTELKISKNVETTVDTNADKSSTEIRKNISGAPSSGFIRKPNWQNKYSHSSRPHFQHSQGRGFVRKRKFCKLCAKGIEHLDYKEVDLIVKYLTPSLKIASRKLTGACSSHQRKISNAVKRARIMALIPYIKD